jgi:hypothetical protein
MNFRKLVIVLALAAVFPAAQWLMAQGRGARGSSEQTAPAQPRPEPARHLLFIATPGDNGTDNQSGVCSTPIISIVL